MPRRCLEGASLKGYDPHYYTISVRVSLLLGLWLLRGATATHGDLKLQDIAT